MNDTLFMVGLAVAVIAIAVSLLSRPGASARYQKVPLLSEAEKHFYRALLSATKGKYTIFTKVRIADILSPRKGMNRKNRNKAFWKISSKHFDFVVCDPSTLDVLCVIELNDKSHQRRDRKKRDVFVEEACKSASLPIIWETAKRKYHTSSLLSKIDERKTQ